VLARDTGIGLALYRVDGPLVVLTRVRGLYPNDTWAGREVTYRRFRCDGGFLSVRLGTDENLFTRAQVVTARERGHVVATARVAPAAQPTLRLRLLPVDGTCTVRFTAAFARVPAKIQPGSTDTRPLAAHYYAFDYVPR
jgi:hypothetical protein